MDLNYPKEQVNETLMCDKNAEPRILHHEVAQNTNATRDKHIMLTKGPKELENMDSPYEIEGPRELHSRLTTKNNEFAIRAHLQELEEHDINENKAIKDISKLVNETKVNLEDLSDVSQKERAKNMINLIKYSHKKHNVERPIVFIKKGNWRSKKPNNDVIEHVEKVLKSNEKNTQACYKTAFHAVSALRSQTDIDNKRISYCEGMAVPKYGGIPNQHAWLEVDSEVIELTWPWSGPYPVETSLYYGFQVPWDKVYSKMTNRPTYASVFMPDEEYYSQPAVQRAIQEFQSK